MLIFHGLSKEPLYSYQSLVFSDKKNYRVIRLENGLTALLISDESYSLEKLDQEEKDLIEKELTADSGEECEEEEDSEEDSEEEDEDEDVEGDSEDESEEDDLDDEGGGGGKRKALESTGLKMSAAGLCVNMGSFSDPDDIPGLAHFLEHMVFMGSKKFPGENEFESFIAKNGGYDNAHTDTETTVFWFESPRRHFHEGMDRFAQFFISPLMKEEAMQREREAVDSEFQMALPSDDNRVIQIFGGLATAQHPMAKFMWGNIDSLKPKGLSDKEIHERLHKFWSRHYTAQSLYLAVQSQHSLDSLQDWVVDCFKEVPNNGLPREDFSTMLEPFSSPDFHKLYEVSPVQNVYKLDLTWALPPLMDRYRVKPLHYLAWIIGHEGRGSLMSFLRRRVWALSIVAGNAGDGFENNSCYSMFPIVITLTKAGYDNIEKVVQSVFTYLDMLIEEGPNQRIFSEIQKIEDLDFAFQEEKHPNDNVETLCENMVFYPPERYLDGDDLLFEYDEAVLRQCLEALVRDKVNIFLRSKEIPSDSLDKVEPWFGTKHSKKDIPESWLEKSQEFRAEFHLPEPNLFIAEDTRVLQVAGETRHPVRVVSDPGGELFYKADTVFQQPRAHIAYLLRSPLQLQSLTNSCLLDLVVMCLLQNITEDVYPADLAQLGYSLYAHECGLVIRVSGLSDKLPNLFRVILDHLADFEVTNFVDILHQIITLSILQSETTESVFSAVKEQQRRNYHNHCIKASKLVRDVRLSVLQDVHHSPHMKHNIVRDVSLQQVRDFAATFKRSLFVQGLVQGNLSQDAALEVDAGLRARLQCSAPAPDTVTDVRCAELPGGAAVLRCDSLANTSDTNTLVTNYYQAGPGSIRDQAVLDTIVLLMEEPVFDTLRTQEQLGYSVSMTARNTYGVLGLSVTVNTQATKFTPQHVDERIEEFFKTFTSNNLNNEAVSHAIQSLIKLKVKKLL